MDQQLERIYLQLGEDNANKLKECKVLVVGVGGVGSYAVEALARTGIGHIVLMDHDIVEVSNLNRQIMATYHTLKCSKTESMKQRIATYNDLTKVTCIDSFFDESTMDVVKDCDFVIDAIDTVTSKVMLYKACALYKVPFISCMGMGNRLDPTKIEVSELMKTSYDPLARSIRTMVRKLGLKMKIPVVCSTEQPMKQTKIICVEGTTRKQQMPPASTIFVPASAGLACASYAIRELLGV